MKKKYSIVEIILAVLLLIATITCVFVVSRSISSKNEKAEKLLKARINSEKKQSVMIREFVSCADEMKELREQELIKKSNDYERLIAEEYSVLQASMWNTDELDEEWYATLFGEPIVYADYSYETPQEMVELLSNAFLSENEIRKVYLGIDPARLYENYYDSVYYDMGILTFEEYIEEYFVSTLASYPNTEFQIILPMKSLSSWSEMSEEEMDDIFNKWYSFVMYLHWTDNTTVSYAGDEEWLIANDNNYLSEYELTDEISKYVYTMNYTGCEVYAPELSEKEVKIVELVSKKASGAYDFCNLNGAVITYFGDSILANHNAYTTSIPSVVGAFTHSEFDNRSIGGTTAAKCSESSFTEMAKEYISCSGELVDKPQIFFVAYGLNDYFNNVEIDNSMDDCDVQTFKGALRTGIDELKMQFPDSKIVMVTPYEPTVDYDSHGENSEVPTFLEYVEAIKNVAEEKQTYILDICNGMTMPFEDREALLTDGVHPSFELEFLLAEKYAQMISGMY